MKEHKVEINKYIDEQKEVCRKLFLEEDIVDLESLIAIGRNFDFKKQVNGLRHPRTESLCGWYIWSGEDFNPEEFDFFKPSHVYHLLGEASFIIKYLGIPPGNRFLIDYKGYEDIWEDKSLLNI